MAQPFARLLIAGSGGDSGKTIVCLGLLAAWKEAGLPLRAFKKGPDFIDAAWLGWAAGGPGRNLDTYMMGPDRARAAFLARAAGDGLNLIEGNRGLLDGLDARGGHSSAALARLLDCPAVLVVNATKMTATAAAVAAGCRQLAPEVRLAGVILNQVGGARHEQVAREAVEALAGLPVLGALPRLDGQLLVSRHLGLVPPAEHHPAEQMRRLLADALRRHVDLDRLLEIARGAPPLEAPSAADAAATPRAHVRIGYFSDSAFSFYYPENLEALAAAGAALAPVSSLRDARLPDIDALYIGGGFPETHTEQLGANGSLLRDVREAARDGLPIYAECGGLMYLAESLEWQGERVPLAGALPLRVRMHDRPQGHGYCHAVVDAPNPLFAAGTELRGHEFHYSSITGGAAGLRTAYAVRKGRGSIGERDGIVQDNLMASYLHLHALGTPQWAPGLVQAAAARRAAAGGARA